MTSATTQSPLERAKELLKEGYKASVLTNTIATSFQMSAIEASRVIREAEQELEAEKVPDLLDFMTDDASSTQSQPTAAQDVGEIELDPVSLTETADSIEPAANVEVSAAAEDPANVATEVATAPPDEQDEFDREFEQQYGDETRKLSRQASEVKPEVPSVITADVPYPPELAPLIASGATFYSEYTNGRPNHWMVKKCSVCGNFKRDECCGQKTVPVIAEMYGSLTRAGKQAAGLEPIEPPKTFEQKQKERIESWKEQPWWNSFRGADELAGSGKVEFLVKDFLMKGGVTFFGGSPEGGKSLVAMSIAKALTTGRPLFGKLDVIEPTPVLWLAAEGGDNGLKIRCKNFRITTEKTKFTCRTLSQGAMLRLDDQNIETLIRQMMPVVILETAVRFGDGDEDSAADTNILAGSIFRLISYGAKAVVAIHHARKNLKDTGVSLESVLRGSSDFGAMADVVIGVIRDEKLYRSGTGVNEIDLLSCKGRDFTPPPIRLALTKKAPEGTPVTAMWRPGFISCIDQTGDLEWVDKGAQMATEVASQTVADRLERMVQEKPTVTLAELAKTVGVTVWIVSSTLRDRGWSKPSGRAKKGQVHRWVKIQ